MAAAVIAAGCGGAQKPADGDGLDPANPVAAAARDEAARPILTLPISEQAVPMSRPILPARVAGDCPSVDACEYGTEWRTCEPLTLYRSASADSEAIRQLKPNEIFTAETGEIELLAPGQVQVTGTFAPEETGGTPLGRNTIIEAYGPLQNSRALYYDPNRGRGWSPAAAADQFWWDKDRARLVTAPIMNWWVKARLGDGTSGWVRLRSNEDKANFPSFSPREVVEAWNIHLVRDDETPDCAGLLKMRD